MPHADLCWKIIVKNYQLPLERKERRLTGRTVNVVKTIIEEIGNRSEPNKKSIGKGILKSAERKTKRQVTITEPPDTVPIVKKEYCQNKLRHHQRETSEKNHLLPCPRLWWWCWKIIMKSCPLLLPLERKIKKEKECGLAGRTSNFAKTIIEEIGNRSEPNEKSIGKDI